MPILINHYSDYIKKKYHERVQKITVHGSLSCPNRDGTKGFGGCSFCNNDAFAAPSFLQTKSVTDQLNHGIQKSKHRYKNVTKYIAYFQSYSNTYGNPSELISKFKEALDHPQVVGLSIGTRPDCMNLEILKFLSSYTETKEIVIELGLESFSDQTLLKINRGHDVQSFYQAVELCHKHNLAVCVHLILGFPWEDNDSAKRSAEELSRLKIKFIKLHQLHVVKETKFAEEYEHGNLHLISKEKYLQLVIDFIEHLSPNIILQRLFGEASTNLLIAPSWSFDMSTFLHELEERLKKQNTFQGNKSKSPEK